MLNKILHFIHHFDEKLHYLLYYSDINGIDIDDAVHRKKCHHQMGRWNFKLADKDYSCGVYRILEAIRERFFTDEKSSMSSQGKDIELILRLSKHDSDEYSLSDVQNNENNGGCDCDCNKKIPKEIFFKVVKPVLDEMLKKTDYKVKTKIVKS